MTNDNSQRIRPIRFDVPGEKVSKNQTSTTAAPNDRFITTNTKTSWWHSQFNLMLAVFGLLAFAAVLFIFLTPPPSIQQVQANVDSAADINSATQATISDAPFDESRRAQARTDAQEILSNFLDTKKDLEEKQVEIWAPIEFLEAQATAEQGDELYKLQDFQPALATYKAAVDELEALYQMLPTYVLAKVSAGQEALLEGKSRLAQEAFSEAIEIEPNNFPALNGLARANTLDEVLDLSMVADNEKQQFTEQDQLSLLLSAEEKLNQAITLDGQHPGLKEQLVEVKTLQTDKRYRDAMTRGFNALFVTNYANAGSAFSAALKIKPNDQTARLAYQQSLASNQTSSLQSLLDRAKAFEASEDWSNAVSNYQTILQRDPNQISAKLGEIRSQARGDLDQQLKSVLTDVLLLSRSNNKTEAERLLGEAQALPSSGPKLQAQIAELKSALDSSDASVKVQIVSDSLTDVTLRKEGANQVPLGRFANKNLVLKPGRYVLTGVRSGFRDERKEIDLYPGSQDLQYFEIRCEQPIRAVAEERISGAT